MLSVLAAGLALALAGGASASAATPLLAEDWRFAHRVVDDAGDPAGDTVGNRYSQELEFHRCDGCPAMLGIYVPGVGREKRFPLRRKGKLLVGGMSCRRPCGGRLRPCSYAWSIGLRIGRTRGFEGMAIAVGASGTVTRRQRDCDRPMRTVVTRFEARRVGRLESGPVDAIAVPGDDCNARVQEFEAEADASGFSELPGRPLSYRWDFGDGTTSTEARPTHTYPASRVYRATVVIRLEDGSVAKGATEADTSDPSPCQLQGQA